MKTLLLTLLALASLATTARAGQDVMRFAVVIGNNQPEGDSDQRLRYADDDAVAINRMLGEAGIQSLLLVTLDDDSRRLHPDLVPFGAPRGKDVRRAMATLSAAIRSAAAEGAATDLLVFYSGHGDVDGGEGYVVLEDQRLTRTQLYGLLAESPASQNHVFIDACKSYFMAFEKGPGGQRTTYARSFTEHAVPAQLSNTGFVLSTSSDHDSHEWERFQAGILSHELRSALRGAADADHDGQITYAELGAFLAAANGAIRNARYRPDILVRPPRGNLRQVLFGWKVDIAMLLLDGAELGHVYVETADGERLLDAHPAAHQSLAIHVPHQRPLFVRRHDDSAEAVVSADEPLRVSALSAVTSRVQRRAAAHLAFEQLFFTPFGARSVAELGQRSEPAGLFLSLDRAREPDVPAPRPLLRAVAATVALGAIAGGLVLNLVALERYRAVDGASQQEIDAGNRTVQQLNTASIACYAAGAAAGLLWGATFWRPGLSVSAGPTGGARTAGLTVTLAGSYW